MKNPFKYDSTPYIASVISSFVSSGIAPVVAGALAGAAIAKMVVDEDELNTKDVSMLTGLSEYTIRKKIRNNELPATGEGNRSGYKIKMDDVIDCLPINKNVEKILQDEVLKESVDEIKGKLESRRLDEEKNINYCVQEQNDEEFIGDFRQKIFDAKKDDLRTINKKASKYIEKWNDIYDVRFMDRENISSKEVIDFFYTVYDKNNLVDYINLIEKDIYLLNEVKPDNEIERLKINIEKNKKKLLKKLLEEI